MCRYAVLRLEEEIRIILDIRLDVVSDRGMDPDEREAILAASIHQLRDLIRAVKILERVMDGAGPGESTLSLTSKMDLRQLGIAV